MTTSNSTTPTILLLPLLMLAFGILSMVFMILVEDEPGAIPTVLIILGAFWTFMIKRKIKRKSNDTQ